MKSLFHQHSTTPQCERRTIIVSCKSSFVVGAQRMDLFLDIGPDEVIKEAGFTHEGCALYVPYASLMCQMLKDKTFAEALAISAEDFYQIFSEADDFLEIAVEGALPLVMMPLWLLREAIGDYKGQVKTHCEILGLDSTDLICRCFGVYGEAIAGLLKKNPKFGVAEITRELKAGGGCTSCVEDLEEIIFAQNGGVQVVAVPDEALLLKIATVLKVWRKHSEGVKKFEGEVQVDFEKEVDGTLFFNFTAQGDDAEKIIALQENLKKYLSEHLPKEKTVFIVNPPKN